MEAQGPAGKTLYQDGECIYDDKPEVCLIASILYDLLGEKLCKARKNFAGLA